jgi:hypothetical protein
MDQKYKNTHGSKSRLFAGFLNTSRSTAFIGPELCWPHGDGHCQAPELTERGDR